MRVSKVDPDGSCITYGAARHEPAVSSSFTPVFCEVVVSWYGPIEPAYSCPSVALPRYCMKFMYAYMQNNLNNLKAE